MSIQARMRARAELQKALADVLPMDPQDGRIVTLAAAIEDLIDAKIDPGAAMFGPGPATNSSTT